MAILKNAYYLGETVFWSDWHGEPAGTGHIDGIYESTRGGLVYRIARNVVLQGRVAALLPEDAIAGRADVPQP